jgi:hypothetical protein
LRADFATDRIEIVRGGHVVDGFIALALFSALLLGLPSSCTAHRTLRKPVAAALGSLGLAQPHWRLFAPNVHKLNSYIVAVVELDDGSTRVWTSPDWRNRTASERFVQGQLPKFYDNLRRDRYQAAWRPFAEWVVRTVAPGRRARSVRLERRFSAVPAPTPEALLTAAAPARQDYEGRHVFYERRLP